MKGAKVTAATRIRALRSEDLEALIAIDQAHTGRSRRGFLAKRLKLATERPEVFIHVGLERDGAVVGFALARLLQGEFGQAEPTAALDLVGVAPDSQEHGYGHQLIDGLFAAAQKKGVRRLQSEAEWNSHSLLRFFDATGFKLANRMVLERRVDKPFEESIE